MDKDKYCLFGTFVKVNGVNGELIIRSSFIIPDKINIISYIFIEIDEVLIPFYVLDLFIRSNYIAVIKLENVKTKEEAKELIDKKIFILKDDLIILPNTEFTVSQLLGFNIFDAQENEIGKIIEIIDIPENPIAKIIIDNKEVLIPVNSRVIISIDNKKKKLILNISQGLLDIYL